MAASPEDSRTLTRARTRATVGRPIAAALRWVVRPVAEWAPNNYARASAAARRYGQPIKERGGRYLIVAAASFVTGQVVLLLIQLILADEQRTLAMGVSVAVCAVPAYYANRAWVWEKLGRSSLRHEIAPFWALVFVGLVSSTLAVAGAEAWWSQSHVGAMPALLTNLVSLSTMLVLWVIRFFWMDAAFSPAQSASPPPAPD